MLIGVCLVSVFTAAITSAITVSSVGSDCQKIQGKQVGRFKFSYKPRIIAVWNPECSPLEFGPPRGGVGLYEPVLLKITEWSPVELKPFS